jgi:SAM-dependent methyltransferase
MREDLFGDLFDKEEFYWWHVAKREMVLSLARSAAPSNGAAPPIGVDLGCGAGYTTKVFDQAWRMVAADVSPEALAFCKSRRLTRLCRVDMTNFALPFKTASVDLILALDVIEHVEDDRRALQECLRILKPGGALVVTVPAFMALWSPWDEILGHKRRYTERHLLDALARSGFSVRRSGYFFFSIFPAAILFRWIKRLAGGDAENYSTDFIPLPAIVNGLLLRVGRVERWLSTRCKVRFPFGLSVAALAVKED